MIEETLKPTRNLKAATARDLLKALPRLKNRLNIKAHFETVRSDLEHVDKCVRQQVETFDPGIMGYIEYATESNGKRIRPALAILSAQATGKVQPAHYDLAVVVEMIHLASLIHDDILDNAEIRRARPTLFAKWGADLSVLLGDCLFAHALKLCSSLPKRESNRLIAEASSEVVTGEILQMQRRFDLKLTLPEYLRIISMKTGALFRVACETSALLNDMPEPCVQALRNYGDALGVAYQIYDDCLDLYGTEESSGKTLGTDLKKGKFTLPLIHLLQHLKEGELAAVSDVIVHGDEAARLALLKQIIDQGGVRYALRKANEFLDRAARGLEVLPDTEYRKTLEAIPAALSEHLETLKA